MKYHRNNITSSNENKVFLEQRVKIKRKGAMNAKNRKVFSEQENRSSLSLCDLCAFAV